MSTNLDLIKNLRNKTGAGFLDCKLALSESNNEIEKAIEYLRKKGLSKASKKTSREAKEGAIGFYQNDSKAIILKVKSETDFAAKSDVFLDFLDSLGNACLDYNGSPLDKDNFLQFNHKGVLISDYFTEMISKIGENLILEDLIEIEKNKFNSSYYIHNSYRNNIGKIISLVLFESNNLNDETKTFSKNICMHIAAMKPESLDISDLDKNLIENEKKIQKEMILSSGKPSNIVEKILEGKMKKFFSEVTLYNQSFILDQDKTVKEIIDEFTKNNSYNLNSFKLISLD